MAILDFEKPKKIRSTEAHNKKYMSDAYVDGTYVPNMSKADTEKWKAKQIGGEDPRIEIRKSFSFNNGLGWQEKGHFSAFAQVLISVRPDTNTDMPQVTMSANGKIPFTAQLYAEFEEAIKEARSILND